jgi:hypothetical protein
MEQLKKLWAAIDDRKELKERVSDLEFLLEMANSENFILKQKRERKAIPVAGFDDLQHEPTDANNRSGYVERVDEFYTDVLQKKLYTAIAEIRELYGNVYMDAQGMGITRAEYDWFVRGMEAGMFKIDEWCRTLQSERNSILQERENNK